MLRIFILTTFLTLLISCAKYDDVHIPANYATLSAALPALSFSLNDEKALQFTFIECYNNQYRDTTDHSFTISGGDGWNTISINIKTDTLRPCTYVLNGRNGTVGIFKGVDSQVASLGSNFFAITIDMINQQKITGSFTGVLRNVFTGQPENISGYYANLAILQ